MTSLTDVCKTYFTSEQRYSAPGGREPWHDPSLSNTTAGFPVPFIEYVFPGGTNFKMTNTPLVPEGYDSMVSPNPTANRHKDAVLGMTYGPFNTQTSFRYTLETGPGTGIDATCTVTAEADLDPSTAAVHTVTQVVTVDERTQEVMVSPRLTTNEGQ